jgi:hypothetical protein
MEYQRSSIKFCKQSQPPNMAIALLAGLYLPQALSARLLQFFRLEILREVYKDLLSRA